MKKIGYIFAASILFFVFSVTDVNAENVEFNITTKYTWTHDIYLRGSTETISPKYSGVTWSTSNRASHRMWFRVISEYEDIQGSKLLNYKAVDTILTNNTSGKVYYLQARRENTTDISATITGIWNA